MLNFERLWQRDFTTVQRTEDGPLSNIELPSHGNLEPLNPTRQRYLLRRTRLIACVCSFLGELSPFARARSSIMANCGKRSLCCMRHRFSFFRQ
jgi:hypothetical protein